MKSERVLLAKVPELGSEELRKSLHRTKCAKGREAALMTLIRGRLGVEKVKHSPKPPSENPPKVDFQELLSGIELKSFEPEPKQTPLSRKEQDVQDYVEGVIITGELAAPSKKATRAKGKNRGKAIHPSGYTQKEWDEDSKKPAPELPAAHLPGFTRGNPYSKTVTLSQLKKEFKGHDAAGLHAFISFALSKSDLGSLSAGDTKYLVVRGKMFVASLQNSTWISANPHFILRLPKTIEWRIWELQDIINRLDGTPLPEGHPLNRHLA